LQSRWHEQRFTRSKALVNDSDGQVDPFTGEFDLVESTGWIASYEHWFNAYWLSNFTCSQVDVDNNDDQQSTHRRPTKSISIAFPLNKSTAGR
jgi:hypothetical protein